MTTEDKDPPADKRTYYRRGTTQNGQRAYLVERSGVQMLKLDSYDPEVLVKFDPAMWTIERELRPLTKMQAARVAYEQDRALCVALHMHIESRKQWVDMSPEERIEFMESGPERNAMRKKLWRSTMSLLEEITG